MGFPSNMKTFRHLHFYEIVKFTDFHATVCSTTALEAPVMGTPNLLMNINGQAKNYFEALLTDAEVTRFADTPEEFVDILSRWSPPSRSHIAVLHSGFYSDNHERALKEALNVIVPHRAAIS